MAPDAAAWDDPAIEDDRLRLIFTCCHPSLSAEAQVAMTLREVCGLKTEEIASTLLTTASTIAQRIVRAKTKIRDARIPYEVPSRADLPVRLDAALQVVYLVFTEGYSASSGDSLTRPDLSGEAIRLGRLIVELLPEPEGDRTPGVDVAAGIAAYAQGISAAGELILLEDQDRSLWNRDQIAEGIALVERALASRRFGRYTLQAAIAAVHAETHHCRRDRLGPDCRPLRRADPGRAVSGRRAQSRCRRGDARRPAGRPGTYRCPPGARRSAGIPSGPLGAEQNCVGDWGERRRRGPPINEPWNSFAKGRSGGFWSGGLPVCD